MTVWIYIKEDDGSLTKFDGSPFQTHTQAKTALCLKATNNIMIKIINK